jgi:hypothetical protein
LKPQKFILCFERTNARDGYVWSVKTGGKWISGKQVFLGTHAQTEFRGTKAKQPIAFIQGTGRVIAGERGYIYIALGETTPKSRKKVNSDRTVGRFTLN